MVVCRICSVAFLKYGNYVSCFPLIWQCPWQMAQLTAAFFTAQRYAIAVYAVVVCSSVRLSVTSRIKDVIRITQRSPFAKDRPTLIAIFFLCQRPQGNSNGVMRNGGRQYMCGRLNSTIFEQYLAISETVQDIRTYTLWKANITSR